MTKAAISDRHHAGLCRWPLGICIRARRWRLSAAQCGLVPKFHLGMPSSPKLCFGQAGHAESLGKTSTPSTAAAGEAQLREIVRSQVELGSEVNESKLRLRVPAVGGEEERAEAEQGEGTGLGRGDGSGEDHAFIGCAAKGGQAIERGGISGKGESTE